MVEVDPFTLELLLDVVADSAGRRPVCRYHPRPRADRPPVRGVARAAGARRDRCRTPGWWCKRSVPQSGRTGAVIERATTKSGRSPARAAVGSSVRPVVEAWAEGKARGRCCSRRRRAATSTPRTGDARCAGRRTGLGRRPHDLRHTAASLWIAAGVDIKTVSAWLGHSTAKLTLDTYGHLMGTDADRAALERVNRALGYRTGPAEGDASRVGESGRPRMASDLRKRCVPSGRFELPTPALGERCSIP